jgi:CDP-diacylglycerol--glycerol-3-phosphate 3-phosphatidyltransferase
LNIDNASIRRFSMVSVYDLKPGFQALLRPVVNGLARAGVTANIVTVFAAVSSVAYGVWLLFGGNLALLLLPVFLFVRMALNAIDGMLAREHGQKTALGAILNEAGDVVSDFALYVPLGFVWGAGAIFPVLVITALLCVGELVGVMGQVLGGRREYQGPFGKSDRAVAFGALSLLAGLGWIGPMALHAVLWLAVGLSIWTLINRASAVLRNAEAKNTGMDTTSTEGEA